MDLKFLGRKERKPDYGRMDAVLSGKKPDRVPLFEIFADDPTTVRVLERFCPALGCKEGGLIMVYGLYPGVPLHNVEALMDAMTRYAAFYS